MYFCRAQISFDFKKRKGITLHLFYCKVGKTACIQHIHAWANRSKCLLRDEEIIAGCYVRNIIKGGVAASAKEVLGSFSDPRQSLG